MPPCATTSPLSSTVSIHACWTVGAAGAGVGVGRAGAGAGAGAGRGRRVSRRSGGRLRGGVGGRSGRRLGGWLDRRRGRRIRHRIGRRCDGRIRGRIGRRLRRRVRRLDPGVGSGEGCGVGSAAGVGVASSARTAGVIGAKAPTVPATTRNTASRGPARRLAGRDLRRFVLVMSLIGCGRSMVAEAWRGDARRGPGGSPPGSHPVEGCCGWPGRRRRPPRRLSELGDERDGRRPDLLSRQRSSPSDRGKPGTCRGCRS